MKIGQHTAVQLLNCTNAYRSTKTSQTIYLYLKPKTDQKKIGQVFNSRTWQNLSILKTGQHCWAALLSARLWSFFVNETWIATISITTIFVPGTARGQILINDQTPWISNLEFVFIRTKKVKKLLVSDVIWRYDKLVKDDEALLLRHPRWYGSTERRTFFT